MSNTPIEQLYRRFLATGDEAALEQWTRRCRPTLRRLALRLGASAEDADDLVQETIVAAIHGAERYDPERPLLPWLKGILTFRAARLARSEVRRREHYRKSQELRPDTEPPVDPVAAELDADVREAIDDLPPRYREPLAQYLLAQRSPLEIAEALGVERATVRTQLHRGLQRLRDALRRWALLLLLTLFGRPARAAVTAALLVLTTLVVLATDTLPAGGDPARPDAAIAAATTATTRPGDPAGQRETAAAATRQRSIVVVVRDLDGHPVAGVGVAAEPRYGHDPVLGRREAITDQRGRATFYDLLWGEQLVSTDRGHRTTVELPAPGHERIEWTLRERRVVQGRCLDPFGAPVPGARVWLSHDHGSAWRGQDVATTDADGRFQLRGVTFGSFVAARHPRWSRSQPVAVAHDDVALQLGEPGGAPTIDVVDEQGRPVREALVFVGDAMDAEPLHLAQQAAPRRAPPFRRRSDADGVARADALRLGTHPVAVRAAGYAPHRDVLDVLGPGPFGHRIVLRSSPMVTGRVCEPDGTPIRNALAVFRHADPAASVDLELDEQGTFCFACVPPESGEVFARAPGYEPGCLHVREWRPPAPPCIVLQRQRVLRGVLRVAGAPYQGAEVRATWPPSALRAEGVVAPTDARGAFALPAQGPGEPTIAVRLVGEPLFREVETPVRWHADETAIELPATFACDSFVAGACRSDDGAAIADAAVFVQRDGSWAEVGATDADGRYRIGPLPDGDYRVFVESRRRDLPTVHGSTFHLPRGAHRDEPLTAGATGTLAVTLVRDDGATISDALMTVQHRDLHRRFSIAHGPSFAQRLVAGDYEVAVMGSRFGWVDAHPVQVLPGERTEARIVVRAAHRCTLVPTGLPPRQPGQAVTLWLRALAPHAERHEFTLLPDAPLRLGAVLPPDVYRLEYPRADGHRYVGSFTVAGVADTLAPQFVPMIEQPQ
ncbi:MAG: sigma-70 family RNA polymerase sigma factor [Planctomycetota bacterium]